MNAIIVICVTAVVVGLNIFASFGVAGFPLPMLSKATDAEALLLHPLAAVVDLVFLVVLVIVCLKVHKNFSNG